MNQNPRRNRQDSGYKGLKAAKTHLSRLIEAALAGEKVTIAKRRFLLFALASY